MEEGLKPPVALLLCFCFLSFIGGFVAVWRMIREGEVCKQNSASMLARCLRCFHLCVCAMTAYICAFVFVHVCANSYKTLCTHVAYELYHYSRPGECTDV